MYLVGNLSVITLFLGHSFQFTAFASKLPFCPLICAALVTVNDVFHREISDFDFFFLSTSSIYNHGFLVQSSIRMMLFQLGSGDIFTMSFFISCSC